jgi:hypothetical protein
MGEPEATHDKTQTKHRTHSGLAGNPDRGLLPQRKQPGFPMSGRVALGTLELPEYEVLEKEKELK